MKTEKFKIFVEALEALPEEIKNNEVDMRSNFEPICGTAGCFAGLISIVANDIPELKKNYSPRDYSPINYSFSDWAKALQDFLGEGLDMWAWENPTIWENTKGLSVYAFNEAWGKKENEKLIHNDIILHLRKALDNLINEDKKQRHMQRQMEIELTQEELKEVLDYNHFNGEFHWIKRIQGVQIYSIAGTVNNITGYRYIRVNGTRYSAHRLAFLYMTGNFPHEYIAHANHKRDDNRWINLRHGSQQENNRNGSTDLNNTGEKIK